MLFYSPSSFSFGYPSYGPRRSYRPASFYEYDEPSGLSASALEDLAFSPLAPTFPPRQNPESRYRRALHELEAAEQEYEAHVAFERARQVAIARQHAAAAEAARHEHAHAIQAEVERVERTRALQALVEERLAHRQHSLRPRAAFGRAPCQGRALPHALVNGDAVEDFAPHRRFSECRRARSQCTHRPERRINGTSNVGDLLELLTGVHSGPEPVVPVQKPTPAAEPQPEPQSALPKRSDAEVTLSDILEFFHGIVAQASDVAGSDQSTHEVRLPFLMVRFRVVLHDLCSRMRRLKPKPQPRTRERGKLRRNLRPNPPFSRPCLVGE